MEVPMKKIVLVILAVVLVSSLTFAEGGATAGQFGLQTGLVFTGVGLGFVGDIGAKYIVTDNIALRAALGLRNISSGGDSTTLFDLGAGFEYHFGGKGGVSPYAGAEISYSGASFSVGGDTPIEFGLGGVFGAEYFFSSNFSWAGEARLGFIYYDDGAGTKTNVIGTLGFATFVTWYIN
jgi:hypothetical protein